MRKMAALVPKKTPTGGNAMVATIKTHNKNAIDNCTDNGNDLNLFHIITHSKMISKSNNRINDALIIAIEIFSN